jgi:hypothetical protein
MRWGAAAAVASGLVVLVQLALRLWPAGQPLSVLAVQMVGREFLGREGAAVPTWLLAAVVHLSWGVFCGGMLAVLTDRVTLTGALGLGALRWFFTQVVVLPAVGFGDFGLLGTPALALATAVPHLAYALCLGWLMRQEEAGHAPLPLHFHWHSWAASHHRRR